MESVPQEDQTTPTTEELEREEKARLVQDLDDAVGYMLRYGSRTIMGRRQADDDDKNFADENRGPAVLVAKGVADAYDALWKAGFDLDIRGFVNRNPIRQRWPEDLPLRD